MKTRNGFVSNSSSSSFIISKNLLSEWQINAIKNHATSLWFKRNGCESYDIWDISEDNLFVYGSTDMDNFSMGEFLSAIGVDPNTISWGD